MKPVSTIHLQSYIDVLLGKTPVNKWIFGVGLEDEREKRAAALDIIRYGVEEILKKKPREAVECLNQDIARRLHWDTLFERDLIPDDGYVRYHVVGDHRNIIMDDINYKHLMHLCYPREVPFDFGEEAVAYYYTILNAKQLNDEGGNVRIDRFRKNFILNAGAHRSEVLSAFLKIIVSDYVVPMLEMKTVDEMGIAYCLYQTFADNQKINEIYEKAQMYDLFRRSYPRFYDMLCEFYAYLGVEDDLFWRKVFALESIMSGAKKKYDGRPDFEKIAQE